MDHFLSISEMAAATGLTEHTLRYYEKEGLVRTVARADSGHRRYSRADVEWVEFLKRLRTTGMPISAMRAFADLRHQGDATAAARRVLLEEQLVAVRAQLRELKECEAALVHKVGHYRKLEAAMTSSQPSKGIRHASTLRKRTGQTG